MKTSNDSEQHMLTDGGTPHMKTSNDSEQHMLERNTTHEDI